MKHTIFLPQEILYLGDKLHKAGHTWQVVGGCVRDALLGICPKDYDLCTSATPQQMMELFGQHKLVLDGLKHGTVGVIVQNTPIEITTYRTEGSYSDSRHPDFVHFTSQLKLDLSRRDFTINAMAYHPTQGITDLFGGIADLQGGIIKCVGDPNLRFGEDALRILRGLRFGARYGFEIEPSTLLAMKNNWSKLDLVADERKASEVLGILSGAHCKQVLDKVDQLLPCLFGQLHISVANLPLGGGDSLLNLALLLWENDPHQTKKILKACKFSSAQSQMVANLLHLGRDLVSSTVFDVCKALHQYGQQALLNFVACKRALGEDTTALWSTYQYILNQNVPYNIAHLDIDGNDLIALGIPPGKQLGNCLAYLLEQGMKQSVKNEKKDLCQHGKMWYYSKDVYNQ